jgi:hypothetical protein
MTEFLLGGTPVAALQDKALDRFVDIFLHGVMEDTKDKQPE